MSYFGSCNVRGGNIVILNVGTVTSTGRTAPKKSVIGTLLGSLINKSFRTPTVEMHFFFGHTAS